MSRIKQLKQGRLLYFSRAKDAISVYENDHLRWLNFEKIVQTIIRKSTPHRLTLPHQWALMMPLLTHSPMSITEFGLGAGSHLRFIQWLNPKIRHHVIEASEEVIHIANTYFSSPTLKSCVTHQEASHWLVSKGTLSDDWYIFDIYQPAEFLNNSYNHLLTETINALEQGSFLSINFPDVTTKELSFWLQFVSSKASHQVRCYTAPHYNNTVLHLYPIKPNPNIRIRSALPNAYQRYWLQYHRRFSTCIE